MHEKQPMLSLKDQFRTVVHSAQYGMSTQFASMNEHQISIAVHSILGGLASQTCEPPSPVSCLHRHWRTFTVILPMIFRWTTLPGCAASANRTYPQLQAIRRCTPHEYLLQYRLRQSKRLLLSSDLTVEQIAEDCGFNSASHFARAFRQETDISPTAFRAISF